MALENVRLAVSRKSFASSVHSPVRERDDDIDECLENAQVHDKNEEQNGTKTESYDTEFSLIWVLQLHQ